MASSLCGLSRVFPIHRRDKSSPATFSAKVSQSSSSQRKERRKKRKQHEERRNPQNILKRIQTRKVRHGFRQANMTPQSEVRSIREGAPEPEDKVEVAMQSTRENDNQTKLEEGSATDSPFDTESGSMGVTGIVEPFDGQFHAALAKARSMGGESAKYEGSDSMAASVTNSDGAGTSSNDGNESGSASEDAALLTSNAMADAMHDDIIPSSPRVNEQHQKGIVYTCNNMEDDEVDWSDGSEEGEVLEVIAPEDIDGDSIMTDTDDDAALIATQALAAAEAEGGAPLNGTAGPTGVEAVKRRDVEKIQEMIKFIDTLSLHSTAREERHGLIENLRAEGVLPITYIDQFPEPSPPSINFDGPVGTAVLGLFERLPKGQVITSHHLQQFPTSLSGFLLCIATGLRRVPPRQDSSLRPSFCTTMSTIQLPPTPGPAVAKVDLNALFRSYLRHHTASLIRASLDYSEFDMDWVKGLFPQLFSCVYDEEYKLLALETTAAARRGAIKRPEGRDCWPCYMDMVHDLEGEFADWLKLKVIKKMKDDHRDRDMWEEIRRRPQETLSSD